MTLRLRWASFVLAATACLPALPVRAVESMRQERLRIDFDTGWLENSSPRHRLVMRQRFDAPGEAGWMRLLFGQTSLAAGSALRLVPADGTGPQVLDADGLVAWGGASAFFGGASVTVELVAAPHSSNRIVIDAVSWGAGDDGAARPKAICDSDDRTVSGDPPVARLLVSYPVDNVSTCTAFITDIPSADAWSARLSKFHLTAGHCFTDDDGLPLPVTSAVVQYNVPLSDVGTCSPNHPASTHQYAVDLSSLRFTHAGTADDPSCGEDWAVFLTHANEGAYDFERQGALHVPVSAAVPFAPGSLADVTGYGADYGNGGCEGPCTDGRYHTVQQIAFGQTWHSLPRRILHDVSICKGTSGGPLWSNGAAIGINVVGTENCEDCSPFDETCNCATRTDHPDIRDAFNEIGASGFGVFTAGNSSPTIQCALPVRSTSPGECTAPIPCEEVAWCADVDGDARSLDCDPVLNYDWPGEDVVVTCDDGRGGVAVKTCPVFVEDHEFPVVLGPTSVVVECTDLGGTPAASVEMQEGLFDLISAEDNCTVDSFVNDAPDFFPGDCPPGALTPVRFTVTDGAGNRTQQVTEVVVVDRTPPVITPDDQDVHCVWPPNHRMVTFAKSDFSPEIVDACSPPFEWYFDDCASDQPDDGLGDGHTGADCVVAEDGSSFEIRAERSGGLSEGRRYSVSIRAVDSCGNLSEPVVIGRVHVPHDRSPGRACGPR